MDQVKVKKILLQSLENSFGNISEACKKAKISRRSFYNYLRDDEEFKEAVEEIEESLIDLAESELYNQISKENTTALIFFLKTKGKKRGYVERTEVINKPEDVDLSGLSTEELIELIKEKEDE